MRTRTWGLACILVAAALATPATVRAQNVPAPAWEAPLPLMLDHRESGFYFATEGLFWRLNNPINQQFLVFRGFRDVDGQATGNSGAFVGTGRPVLSTTDIGADKWEPGVRFTIGYRFQNDLAFEVSYWELSEYRHTANAGIIPENFDVGITFADSFLFSPFFNFGPEFAGPIRDAVSIVLPPDVLIDNNGNIVGVDPDDIFHGGKVIPLYGIWNGAEQMTLEFTQRAENIEANFRYPVLTTECTRTYFITGPRYTHVYERFKWRTADLDIDGFGKPEWQATYNNEWDNRFIGAQFGAGSEYYLGKGFALSLEARVGAFANIRSSNIKIERGDESVAVQRHRNDQYVSGMVQGGAFMWWFPIEGVQIRWGYEFLGFGNATRSTLPVDWNVGHLDPHYTNAFMRFDGWNLGVAIIF